MVELERHGHDRPRSRQSPRPSSKLRQRCSIAVFASVKVIAVSSGIYNKTGRDLIYLDKHITPNKSSLVVRGSDTTNDQLLLTPCYILVPAALERQITH